MPSVNALDSLTVLRTISDDGTVTNAATLIFRKTTTPPKAGLLAGAGVVRKTGATDWAAYNNSQNDFMGEFCLAGGLVSSGTATAFGHCATAGVGALHVEDGGAVMLDGENVKFIYRKVCLAGAGNASQPYALKVGPNVPRSGINYIVLEADAALTAGKNYYWISSLGDDSIRPYNQGRGLIDLGPYTLSRYATDYSTHLLGCDVLGTGSIVIKELGLVFREDSRMGLGEPGEGPIVFASAGAPLIYLYNQPLPIRRPARFTATTVIECSGNNNRFTGLFSTNFNCFAGPVELVGADVRVCPEYTCNAQISFLAPVSGTGRLVAGYGNGVDVRSGIVRLAARNTYTGGTLVTSPGLMGLVADYPDSIPDWANTYVTNAYLAARPQIAADGTWSRWSPEAIYAAMNNVQLGLDGHFAIDASDCPGGVFELAAADLVANVPNLDQRGLGTGGGTLRLRVPAGSRERLKLASGRGRLELVGGGTVDLAEINDLKGAVLLDNPDKTPLAEVRVTDGIHVVQDDAAVFVGGRHYQKYYGSRWRSNGRLVISNATWTTTCTSAPSSGDEPEMRVGMLWVGHENNGILEIQKDAFVSNRVICGGGANYHSGCGAGAIYQSGGTFYMIKRGANHLSSCLGSKNYGYYELTDGFFRPDPVIHIGNYGDGLVHQYGGRAESSRIELAVCNNGKGVLYMCGGVWEVLTGSDSGYLRVCSGNDTASFVTLEGEGTKLLLNSHIYGPQTPTGWAYFAVNNGARLRFERIVLYNDRDLNTLRLNKAEPLVLNVNGGILETKHEEMLGVSSSNRFSRVAVYEKGMTIDNSNNMTQHDFTPIEGLVDGGIAAIDLGEPVENLLGAPRVEVVTINGGTGAGAMAVADWDPATRVLKGVHVTAHGWGYEADKVKVVLYVGDTYSKELTGSAITIAPNRIGGFTKTGSGTLSLYATNTWAQWTRVTGGTLRMAADWAVPPGTEVTVANGALFDFNGKTTEVARIVYGVGGGSVAGRENVVVAEGPVARVSTAELQAGKSVTLPANTDLTTWTVDVTGDVDALCAGKSRAYALCTAPGGLCGRPVFRPAANELPVGWVYDISPTDVSLRNPRGLRMILR